jgi:ATP-dependent Clp protease adaptor protein ClpS
MVQPARASTPEKTAPVLLPETVPEVHLDRGWNVVVWDDPVNLMSYVVYVFRRIFGFSVERATRHMLEVHHQGRSVVITEDREQAEHHVARLHLAGLQATLERVESA